MDYITSQIKKEYFTIYVSQAIGTLNFVTS